MLLSADAFGQSPATRPDTSDTVRSVFSDPVLIRSTRFQNLPERQPTSVKIIEGEILTSQPTQTLDQLLGQVTLVSLRSYGPGGSSLMSIRGWGARNSQVLWNGLPVNHPMLGVADLSIIPLGGLSSIEVSAASGSGPYGSQGHAGTLYMRSAGPSSTPQGTILTSLGSYGLMGGFIDLRSPVANGWNVSTLGSWSISDNDFEYQTRAFDPTLLRVVDVTRRRAHNNRERLDAQLNVHRTLDRAHFSSFVWIHDSKNQIPGGIQSLSKTATQFDQALRWASELLLQTQGGWLRASAGVARVNLDYQDDAIDVLSESASDLLQVSLEHSTQPMSWLLQTRWLEFRMDRVETSDYSSAKRVNATSLAQQAEIILPGNTLLKSVVRLDVHSESGAFWTGSVGVNQSLFEDRLFIRGSIARSFSNPTLNDLYWTPGGNPSLLPENGFHAEVGLLGKVGSDRFWFKAELTPYLGVLSDGIRWLPRTGSTVWSPVNIDKIRSKGLEASVSIAIEGIGASQGRLLVDLMGQIQHVHPLEDSYSDDRTVGLQLPYTPDELLSAFIEWTTQRISAMWVTRWTGDRYTTTDHSGIHDPLSGFQHSSIHLSGRFGLFSEGQTANAKEGNSKPSTPTIKWRSNQSMQLLLTLRIDNVLDSRYEIFENHPMPGRNLQLTAGFRF